MYETPFTGLGKLILLHINGIWENKEREVDEKNVGGLMHEIHIIYVFKRRFVVMVL